MESHSTEKPFPYEKNTHPLPPKADIFIVGAGPIGLEVAAFLKILDPTLEVVIAEKYETYQRKHNLIMQPKRLEALMKATGTLHEPILADLLQQLKKNPRIRTNKLEEKFKALAEKNQVKIIHHHITENNIHELSEFKEPPQLIIGADGTHSTVSANLFPIDNQIKYEFDYVLQLRYEIESKEKPEPLDQIALFQQMAQQGMIANEYVGHTENQKTPVTMQMMISKQEFEELKDRATSKNPIVFDDKNIPELPKRLSQFVNLYLKKTLQKKSEHATLHDIRISVNEAPATHAKEIVDIRQNILKLLVGDAALGLSYFKGLNAGLEASAKLFSYIAPILKNGGLKKNKNAFQSALLRYQEWFLDDFAPKKVKEVAQYSTWQINGAWNLMRSLRFSKVSSFIEYDHDPKYLIADHLNRQAQKEGVAIHWNPYPHRPYDPEIRIWELGYVPLDYSSKKIKKIFTDYATPYKAAPFQLTRELQKPLADTALSLIGLGKLVGGMVTLDPKTMEDGAASFARGALGLATFPAAWIIKPITKGISTAIFGYQKIEENTGIQELVQKGKNLLHKESDLSVEETIRIKHICFDLNRKFNTSIKKGQATDIKQMEEFRQINILRESTDKRQFEKYFSLFALSHPEPVSPLTQRKWISSKSIQ